MKKFTDIADKKSLLDFKSKQSNISTDIENLNNLLSREIEGSKLGGGWEIISVIDVTTETPIDESLIINAELGNKEIKRGDVIYITAQIKKPGQSQAYNQSQIGVIKCTVRDIYNTMSILNNLK